MLYRGLADKFLPPKINLFHSRQDVTTDIRT